MTDILISAHGRDQLWARCAERRTDGVVKAEIASAVREGRTGARRPRWLDRGQRNAYGPGAFFCWPEDRDRCYVVRRDGGLLVLVTVLLPELDVALGFGRAGAAA